MKKVWHKSLIIYFLNVNAFGIFIYFVLAVKSGERLKFDQKVSAFFLRIFGEPSYVFFKTLNVIGSSVGIGIILLIATFVLWIKNKDYVGMAILTLSITFGALLNKWLKNTIGRPRPETEHLVHVKSLSFPSGHAMMNTILFILIAYFIVKEIQSRSMKWLVSIIAGLFIFIMGVSRVVLQVHYPSDVTAGFALGFVWAIISIALYKKMNERLAKS